MSTWFERQRCYRYRVQKKKPACVSSRYAAALLFVFMPFKREKREGNQRWYSEEALKENAGHRIEKREE